MSKLRAHLLDPRITKAKNAIAQGPTGYLDSSFYSMIHREQNATLGVASFPSIPSFSNFLFLSLIFLDS